MLISTLATFIDKSVPIRRRAHQVEASQRLHVSPSAETSPNSATIFYKLLSLLPFALRSLQQSHSPPSDTITILPNRHYQHSPLESITFSMAVPNPINVKPFSQYRLLSFDIYGTLINWEGGITNAIWGTPYFSSLPSDSPLKTPEGLLKAFHLQERTLQHDTPSLLYAKLLSQAFVKLVKEHVPETIAPSGGDFKLQEAADKFGNSVGTWPAFPDTVAAMERFKDLGYLLVPLSNTDRASVNGTITGPLQNTHFDAVYIAEDIGSYKPNLANFEYLLKQVKEKFGTSILFDGKLFLLFPSLLPHLLTLHY